MCFTVFSLCGIEIHAWCYIPNQLVLQSYEAQTNLGSCTFDKGSSFDKAAFLQTTFSKAFSWMETPEFQIKFLWNKLLRG